MNNYTKHFLLVVPLLLVTLVVEARFHQNDKLGYAFSKYAAHIAQKPHAPVQRQPQKAVEHIAQVVSAKTADLMQGVEHPFVAQQEKAKTLISNRKTRGVPSIDQAFLAADYRETGQYGPSAEGSAGSCQFLHCNKGKLRTFNKATGEPDGIMNLTMDRFFSPIKTGNGFTSDPGCVYDSCEHRWYMICDGVYAPSSGIMLAISDNGNGTGDPITPQTVWHYIIVDQCDNPGFEFAPVLAVFDYTTIGFDQNYIYCSADVFNVASESYFSSAAYVIPKVSAVTGGAPTIYAFRDLVDQNTLFGPCFKWPAINYDANPTTAFFVGTNVFDAEITGDAFQFLINEVDLNTMTMSAPISLAVNEYVGPIPVQPLGTPAYHLVEPVVGFINCEAHIRNNQLFMIHNVGVDDTGASTAETTVDRNGIRYYQVDISSPATPALVNFGALFDSSATQLSYMDPSWMSNSAGKLLLGATQSSPTNYLDAMVAQVDPGTFVVTGSMPYTASTTSYNATDDWEFAPDARWGDHTRVSLDPDGITFWTCQQWCSDVDTWGLQVAEVTAN